MSVEMLQTVSLVCFGAAGLFLLIAAVLFFVLDVPALMGEATGATERKAIASIRSQNRETGDVQSAKPSKSARSSAPRKRDEGSGVGTAKLSTAQLHVDSSSKETGNETTLLQQPQKEMSILERLETETTILRQPANAAAALRNPDSETTVLSQSDSVTAALSQPDSGTTILNQPASATPILDMLEGETTGELLMPADTNQSAGFSVEVEFEYASSGEIIE